MRIAENVSVKLDEVPETLLWNLYQRSLEARRADTVLPDPLGVELVERIDYRFERFGQSFGQWQALRAKTFDLEVRRFLAAHPGGTVVALGEGLETGFWRVDNAAVRWVSVDLPEVVALRENLLPASPRLRSIGASVTDAAWAAEVDASAPVLLLAQGLLMYLERDDVDRVLRMCGERFPGSELVFDAVPVWLRDRSAAGKLEQREGYNPPPWSWGIDAGELERLRTAVPQIAAVHRLRPPRGRGAIHGLLLPLAGRIPPLRDLSFWLLRAEFA